MRRARTEDLERIWSLLQHHGAFLSFEELKAAYAANRGEVFCSDEDPLAAGVLGRWRSNLPIGWIRSFSAGRHPHLFARDLAEELLSKGYHAALSPILHRSETTVFIRAGYELSASIAVLENTSWKAAKQKGPADILLLSPEQVDEIKNLDGACFNDFWAFGREELLPLLAGGLAMGALLNDELVGYTILEKSAGKGVLVRLAVDMARRRLGIGRQLATSALNWFADRGITSVILTTQEENEPALALYKGLGFKRAGRQFLYIYTR